jgi:hypothetical protein
MPSEQKKGRNEGDSAVHGISASKEFWEAVRVKMEQTGKTKAKLIVDTCIEAWGLPDTVKSKRVGRPTPKLRKG